MRQWEWEMNGWAQIDMVGGGDEWLGSKKHGGSRRRAIVLKLMWWEWDTSSQAQIDTVGVGDKQSGSN